MYFSRVYDEALAQASYIVACQRTGEALVVDPRRDVGVYLAEAARQGLTIGAVAETHIHADYLSGAGELASATGAQLYLSEEGGEAWRYAFDHTGLRHGDKIRIGNITVEAIHTPGHTPEHLSFLVTDGARASEPVLLLTGDFVFIGDLGRPDLLDAVAGGNDSRFVGAGQMLASLRDSFLTLPDHLQVWPGHGAGSACGKALGAVASTTVGYERRFAWWSSYLRRGDETRFIDALLEGQPDAPLYFGRMKRQNREGPALLGERPVLEQFSAQAAARAIERGATLIDTRPARAYARSAVPGSLHLPEGTSFATWAAWLIDPERLDGPLILYASDQGKAHALRDQLSRVGIDRVAGFVGSLDGLVQHPHEQISVADLAGLPSPVYLDVRTANEHVAGHLPGAKQIHAGRLIKHLDELPRDRPLVVYCQSGNRSAAAASALRASGFDNVYDLAGGYQSWWTRQDPVAAKRRKAAARNPAPHVANPAGLAKESS